MPYRVINTAGDEEYVPMLEEIIANYEKNGVFDNDIFDYETRKDLLSRVIHEQIEAQMLAGEAEIDFDNVLDYVKTALGKHCSEFFTDTELRRIIGSEIGWHIMTKPDSSDIYTGPVYKTMMRYSKGRSYEDWRGVFLDKHVLGKSEHGDDFRYPDPSKVSERGRELEKYIKTWADFPAYGFGIENLDRATGGLLPAEICVLTGAPGTMKTSLALSMADDFVTRGAKGDILYVSADMPGREIKLRMLERETETPAVQLRYLLSQDTDKARRVNSAVDEKYNSRLAIISGDDGIVLNLENTFTEILARQPQLVIIDYLTRLKGAGQSDLEFVENAMRRILEHAHRYETSFLILSQMSRASRSDQAAGRMGGHSRGGGIVEELADCEIELFQQFNEDEAKPLIIACVTKARRGIAGQYFALDYQGEIKKFTGFAQRMKKEVQKRSVFTPQNRSFY